MEILKFEIRYKQNNITETEHSNFHCSGVAATAMVFVQVLQLQQWFLFRCCSYSNGFCSGVTATAMVFVQVLQARRTGPLQQRPPRNKPL
jgi:hypothetical protein